jgi:hypothetical protein
VLFLHDTEYIPLVVTQPSHRYRQPIVTSRRHPPGNLTTHADAVVTTCCFFYFRHSFAWSIFVQLDVWLRRLYAVHICTRQHTYPDRITPLTPRPATSLRIIHNRLRFRLGVLSAEFKQAQWILQRPGMGSRFLRPRFTRSCLHNRARVSPTLIPSMQH